jgi:hypothetical protein
MTPTQPIIVAFDATERTITLQFAEPILDRGFVLGQPFRELAELAAENEALAAENSAIHDAFASEQDRAAKATRELAELRAEVAALERRARAASTENTQPKCDICGSALHETQYCLWDPRR